MMKFMDMGPYPIEFGFCTTGAEWHQEMKERQTSEAFPQDTGVITPIPLQADHLLLVATFREDFRKLSGVDQVGLVFHEALHVWHFIKEHIGEDDAGWEVEAYTVQWIGEWILKQLAGAGWIRLREAA